MLTVRNIHKNFGEKLIINDLSFDIKKKDRIGLIGINGAGKSTLANMIYGTIKADSGTIIKAPQLRIGYLKQSVDYQLNVTQQQFTSDFLEKTSELGLTKYQAWDNERFSHLSGGETHKVALAEIWSSYPDILLLDEPTNHLDFQGINWLIEQLNAFKGAVVVISHDRYFLDKAVNRIFDLEEGKLTTYEGNYSSFYEKKKKIREDQLHHFQNHQRNKARIEGQMDQLRQWAGKAHRTMRDQEGFKEYHGVKAKKLDRAMKSKMKRLSRELEKNIEKPSEEKTVHFQFEKSKKRGKRIIEAKYLSKVFQARTLFRNSHFYINHGEKIGIYGSNGSGKTTFLKILLGEESLTSGQLSISSTLKVASLSQDVGDMDVNQTGLEVLQLTERDQLLKARTTLANMGIDAKKLNQPLGSLSLGERTRIKLTNMLLNEYDVLILDEPTNHLDLATRNQLEKTLSEFAGTILVVSHDFYFLQHVCEKLLVFEEQKIKRVEMTIEDYEARRNSFQQQHNTSNKQEIEDELLRVNTEISAVLGEISSLTPDSSKYQELDLTFQELIKRKRDLQNLH